MNCFLIFYKSKENYKHSKGDNLRPRQP